MANFCSTRKFLPIILALVFVSIAIAANASRGGSGRRAGGHSRNSNRNDEAAESALRAASLRQVTVVFRHSHRTPADTYPNDPHINSKLEPYGWGQLTNEGKLAAYNQGLWLAKRYGPFLGTEFATDIFQLQTTAVDRAQMSGMLTSAGLWVPKGTQLWKSNLKWQPTPIKYQELDQDTLLLVRTNCRAYYRELDAVKNGPEYQRIQAENKQLYDELTALTGMSISNPDDIMSVYGTLRAESDLGLPLPDWTKDYYPDRLVPLTVYSYLPLVQTDLLKRLKGGPFVKKIVNDMKGKVAGTEKKKMFMYTGHDSTITNLLGTMGVWDPQQPEYGILTTIELHENSEGWNVQMFLRNTTQRVPYPLTVPGCDTVCPLDKFIELLTPVIPVDWEEECKIDDDSYVAPTPLPP